MDKYTQALINAHETELANAPDILGLKAGLPKKLIIIGLPAGDDLISRYFKEQPHE